MCTMQPPSFPARKSENVLDYMKDKHIASCSTLRTTKIVLCTISPSQGTPEKHQSRGIPQGASMEPLPPITSVTQYQT